MNRRTFLQTLSAAAFAPVMPAPPERIDTHIHIHRPVPDLINAFKRDNWRSLSICVSRAVGDEASVLDEMIRGTIELHRASQGRTAWATSFDPRSFESHDFADRTNAGLQQSFAQGAIAVKIWKNIGMAIQSKTGMYLMPDHPALADIYRAVQKSDKTLIAHLAEPDGAWLPLGERNPETPYYSKHPEWHMYTKTGAPSKEEILAARDRVLERNPKLRVVGCHLGSNEEHWDRLAQRLDTFPNFAVDVAARVRYFVNGDHAQAREFLLKYQDRVLYGTDFTLAPTMTGAQAAEGLGRTHDLDWNFFATTNTITYRNVQTTGLGLPETVVRKIFYENAIRWLPGIASR